MSVDKDFKHISLLRDLHITADIPIYSELSQILRSLIARFQDTKHEEVVVLFGEHVLFSMEKLPEFLKRNNSTEGIIVQQFNSNDTNAETGLDLCDSFETQSTSTPVKVFAANNDLDTTGSPLKCPFVVNKDDAYFSPLTFNCIGSRKKIHDSIPAFKGMSINIARTIASKLLSTLKQTSNEDIISPPIWIACNSLDVQKTVFIGINYEPKATLMNVTSSGPHAGLDNLPTVDHLTSHFCFACPNLKAESSVEALYDILSCEDGLGSSVHISSSWKRPLSTLSSPALDAHSTVQVHIDDSDVRSDAHQIYVELSTLEGFILGLETYEVNWLIRKDEPDVKTLLQEYFKSIVHKDEKRLNEDDSAANLDKIIDSKFFQVRQNMEFTDKLWSILTKCESNSELQNGLSYTFEAITNGVIRPQIPVKNKTKVAEISRNLMRGLNHDLDLEGLASLEMLIEIGLEKIKRDYISIFQVCELATSEQLQPFINWNFTQEPFINCLNKLKEMHTALQVVVVLRKYLQLPPSLLSQCTTQVFAELLKTNNKEDFVFPLQTSIITNVFKSKSPALWKLNISSQTASFYKSMDFYIKRDYDYFISGNNKDFDLRLEKKENEDVINYYCLAVTSTTDEFLMGS